jgi:RNA polymerase sigma-70 factor (ECF subfamily)
VGDVTAQPPGTPVSLDALLAHREWVRALARSLVRDEHRADDVEQETWRMALERPPRHATSLRAWFGTVVRNAARGAGRRAASRARFESMAAPRDAAPSPADVVAEAEVQHRLVEAVLALGEPYRTTVLLRWFQGLETSEIAERCGEPVETVRTRLKRAVERLRRRMDVDLGDDRDAWLLLVWGRRAPPKGTGTAAAPLGSAGGLAMGAATKLAAGAAAAIVLAALAWTVTRSGSAPTVQTAASGTSDAHVGSHAARVRTGAAEADAAPAPSAPLPPPVDLDKCDRDLDLHGVVVTLDGKPVAGASIATVTSPWRDADTFHYDAFDDEVRGPSTRSASDGTFALRLARGDSVTLRVSAAGFARRELPLRQAGERVRIVLDPGVRLTVTIRDAAGGPLADVPVRILRAYEGDETFSRDASTGADGRGVIDGLPGGVTGYLTQGPKSRVALPGTRVVLPASGETAVELVAKGDCRTLAGRVLDDATGRAIEGARVGMGENLRIETASAADGSFVLGEWNGDADTEVHVLAEGHARAVAFAGDGQPLEFRLKPDASAMGRVVGAGGAPVAGAMVSIVWFKMDARPWGLSAGFATSGADGRFRVGGLARDTAHTLVVVAPEHARLLQRVTPTADGADLGDVVLAAPRAIEGRVLAGDAPVEREHVTLMDVTDRWASSRGPPNRDRYTDDLGRFRFRDLAPGRYAVVVQRRGAPGSSCEVEVPTDRDILDVTLRVPATRDVVVRVTDETGAFVPGIWVMATASPSAGGTPINARTDANGAARIAVPTGEVKIRAIPSGADARPFVAPEPRALAASEREVVIVLREGTRTTGRVVGPDGEPVPHAPVAIVQAGGRSTQATADAEGRFEAVVAPNGALDLSFDGLIPPDRGPSATDTGLRGHLAGIAPGTRDVVLRCERVARDRTLRVLVVAPDGTPVTDAPFWYATGGATGQGTMAFAKTGREGRATLTGLTPDELALSTMISGEWYASVEQRAKPDGGEVTLAYRRAIVVAGTAAWPDGSVPKKCDARLCRGEVSMCGNDTDASGRFRLLAPAGEAGPYVVVVSGMDEKGRFEGRSEGLAGAASDVRVVLERK